MTATLPPRSETRRDRVAEEYAALLAGVLKVAHVPVESHFFDELGADSLLMAQFCARVRKRSDLPTLSIRDIYATPSIAGLARAVAARAPTPVAAPAPEPPTPTSALEHVTCGALQILFYLGYSYLGVLAVITGYEWMVEGATGLSLYLRLTLFSGAGFLVVTALPIAAKWLLIGRWRAQRIRLWSLGYVRFWVVKTLIRSNPGVHLFIGSPLYPLYLRALGARIGPRVLLLTHDIPVCTDLLSIGADTVVRAEASLQCYRADAGRIETGPVTIGRDSFVGEMAVLDIGTGMGDGAQLGHTSALLQGQTIPAGERWHGSPARRTETNYLTVPAAPCSSFRRFRSGILTLVGVVLVWAPLLELGIAYLFTAIPAMVEAVDPGARTASGALTFRGLALEALALSVVLFFGATLASLLLAGTVPRLLSGFLVPGKAYPLYGFHHAVHRVIGGLSSVKFLGLLFGDSSYMVHFLRWLGWRLTPVVQTGSNFGCETVTTNPFLSAVGTGTMVADGLNMMPHEYSSSSFRVSPARIGPRNFIGNYVNFPAGGRTGENCLLAVKAMVPIDGPVRSGVGLLGSPPFEIPRSVERDGRFDHLRTGEALRRGLAAKDRFNLRTMGILLLTRWGGVFLAVMIDVAAFRLYADLLGHAVMATLFALSAVLAAIYYAAVEGLFERLSPPPPTICSIYDERFWWVERVWKLHPIHFFGPFDGTPFKSVLWRLIGVRMGRRVFDDGVYISEPTLTTIGDECVLNRRSIVQCDSQEDGTYKSGPTTLGRGCTLGANAFVHYGVTMGDHSTLAPDAFLMKGEEMPANARWEGNPARSA
jgi:non-ribosomal peptide synthetase-like protein